MDGVYYLNETLTTYSSETDLWAYVMIYISNWIAGGIDSAMYNCYLFGVSV
jgi:hypothetical protein